MCVITGKLRNVYEVRMHVYSYTAFFWYISYKFCRQIMIRGGAGRGYAPSNQARPPGSYNQAGRRTYIVFAELEVLYFVVLCKKLYGDSNAHTPQQRIFAI
jgi:hypothetical protein